MVRLKISYVETQAQFAAGTGDPIVSYSLIRT